jgi:hypothetical protein
MTIFSLDNWGLIPSIAKEFFLFATVPKVAQGLTQPPIQWVLGALPWEVKQTGLGVNHSLPLPRLRVYGTISPIPQYVFMAWCLVKHRDNFTFTFFLYSGLFE